MQRGLWLGEKSRMSREAPVRFREGPGVKFPRATRLVICCRGTAAEAMAAMRGMMSRLRLTVNEAKTRLCRVPGETFDFLGYTFGRFYSPRTGRPYLGVRPSAKKVARLRDAIRELTDCRYPSAEVGAVVGRLNLKLRGWSNYFCLGTVSPAYGAINRHGCHRLRRWLSTKHRVEGGISRYPDRYLHEVLGLVRLGSQGRSSPWANA